MPPPARNRSKLGRHPAQPVEAPAESDPQDTAPSRASARTRVPADTGTQVPADTGTQVPADTGTQVPADQAAEQRAQQKAARDAAYGWAAAARKQAKRGNAWAAALDRARRAGVPPALLREQIQEAAYQAGIPVSAISNEVWRSAGLNEE